MPIVGNANGVKDIAYVFQDATLLPWLNVAENVVLPLRIRGAGKSERQALTDELLRRVGLGSIGALCPRQLSGGMKVRVSVLAHYLSPRILLLDEPFGALDEMTRDALNGAASQGTESLDGAVCNALRIRSGFLVV